MGAFFEQQGFDVGVIDLYRGQELPKGFEGIEALISLGGPMNVYEQQEYPFLRLIG